MRTFTIPEAGTDTFWIPMDSKNTYQCTTCKRIFDAGPGYLHYDNAHPVWPRNQPDGLVVTLRIKERVLRSP